MKLIDRKQEILSVCLNAETVDYVRDKVDGTRISIYRLRQRLKDPTNAVVMCSRQIEREVRKFIKEEFMRELFDETETL